MTASTDIQGTLVQLESLYKAYSTILEDAKEQLGSLAVDDETVRKIANVVKKDPDLQKEVKQDVITAFAQSMRDGDADALDHWRGRQFMKMVTDHVMQEIKNDVVSYVSSLLEDADIVSKIDERAKQRVDAILADRTEISDAVNTHRLIKAAVVNVLDDN